MDTMHYKNDKNIAVRNEVIEKYMKFIEESEKTQ